MKQVVQPLDGGSALVVDAPAPILTSTMVLVRSEATLIPGGAEIVVSRLARSRLLEKARSRPDLVRQVVARARIDGLGPAVQAVRARLADDLALGYSGAGVVVEVGSAVRGLEPGQRVATGGGGYAHHAEFQAVPWVLTAALDDTVMAEQAAFATVAAEGLHGLRQGDVRIGSKVLVVGLGLLGQLTARMAVASGCEVFAIDPDQRLVDLAAAHGAQGAVERGRDTTAAVLAWSRGRGADTVIITAGVSHSSAEVRQVPERCRDRAVVVAVGDVGLDLNRDDFYHRELELRLARSYGPGRHDRSYEEWGVDYPVGHVRWTEGRNLEAVVDLLASGRMSVDDLISHRFPIDEASRAYDIVAEAGRRTLGVILTYPRREEPRRSVDKTGRRGIRPLRHRECVGLIGAGNVVRSTVLPALRNAGYGPVVHVASASGLTAARMAERERIGRSSSDHRAVLHDPAVDLVVVATPHANHAELVVGALRSGKNVYCEKPLALSWEELSLVEKALVEAEGNLYVGFNRRYAPMVSAARWELEKGTGPAHLQYRVNAGPVPSEHWYADRRHGGRLLGEVCHFVDTCNAVMGDMAVTTVACAGSATTTNDSYHLLIGYADGSTASIMYASDGNPRTPRERIEIMGAGRTIEIDNFSQLRVNGDRVDGRAGRGHDAGLKQFRLGNTDIETALETTRITLRAADALRMGQVDDPPGEVPHDR